MILSNKATHIPVNNEIMFFSKRMRLALTVFCLLLLSIGIVESGFNPLASGREKLQAAINNQENNRLSTIAVTSMPLIIALKEKFESQSK